MTTEAVLTDERIFALGAEIDITSANPNVDVLMFSRDDFLATGRAFERAVLQSPEMQQRMESYAAARVREALEAAAQLCDAQHIGGDNDDDLGWTSCAANLAHSIRTLIPSTPA